MRSDRSPGAFVQCDLGQVSSPLCARAGSGVGLLRLWGRGSRERGLGRQPLCRRVCLFTRMCSERVLGALQVPGTQWCAEGRVSLPRWTWCFGKADRRVPSRDAAGNRVAGKPEEDEVAREGFWEEVTSEGGCTCTGLGQALVSGRWERRLESRQGTQAGRNLVWILQSGAWCCPSSGSQPDPCALTGQESEPPRVAQQVPGPEARPEPQQGRASWEPKVQPGWGSGPGRRARACPGCGWQVWARP